MQRSVVSFVLLVCSFLSSFTVREKEEHAQEMAKEFSRQFDDLYRESLPKYVQPWCDTDNIEHAILSINNNQNQAIAEFFFNNYSNLFTIGYVSLKPQERNDACWQSNTPILPGLIFLTRCFYKLDGSSEGMSVAEYDQDRRPQLQSLWCDDLIKKHCWDYIKKHELKECNEHLCITSPDYQKMLVASLNKQQLYLFRLKQQHN